MPIEKNDTGRLRHNARRAEILEHAAAVALGDIPRSAFQVAIAKALMKRQQIDFLPAAAR